ncbi:hypothetical protein DVA76_19860, partial [Acinetobacter baumannii]
QADGHSVTLTDQPQTDDVEYKLKDASKDIHYQPKFNGANLGTAQTIPVDGEHGQGDKISYTPGEVRSEGKVYVPVQADG